MAELPIDNFRETVLARSVGVVPRRSIVHAREARESRPENDRDETVSRENRHDALTPVLDPGPLPRRG